MTDAGFVHRFWKERFIPSGEAIVPSVLLVPTMLDRERDDGETNPHIAEVLVKLFSSEGDVILDPFGSHGVVCRKAKELGRRPICLDVRNAREGLENSAVWDAVNIPVKSESVDLIITSLPRFGEATHIREGPTEPPSFADYVLGMKRFLEEAWRILKPGGVLVVRVSDAYVGDELLPVHTFWIERLRKRGFVLRHILIYVYWDSNFVAGSIKKVHDYILVATKPSGESGGEVR
jgi:DNA modification methylase